MRGPVLIVLVGVLAVLGLLAVAGLVRHRALLRAPGSFPGIAVTGRGRPRRVIGRYDERVLVFNGFMPAGPLAWRGERWALQMDRVPDAAPEGQTVLDVRGGSEPVRLTVDEADAGALRAWCEAGPSQAAQLWWRGDGSTPSTRR